MVTHRYFEWTIMVMILVSSVGLASDTPYLSPRQRGHILMILCIMTSVQYDLLSHHQADAEQAVSMVGCPLGNGFDIRGYPSPAALRGLPFHLY